MHSVHTMRPIATDVARLCVSVGHIGCTVQKTAKSIEMPFGGWLVWAQGIMGSRSPHWQGQLCAF